MSRRPLNELAVAVPIVGVLNRSSDVVVALVSTRVHSAGVLFDFEVFRRQGTVALATYGFGRPEATGSSSAPPLLGFAWADGSYSSNMPLRQNAGGLHHVRGSGGVQHAEFTLFLDHLPPPGPFHVVTEWPYFDIAEGRAEFDATVLIDAAERVEQFWEETTPEPMPRTPEEREVNRQLAILEIPRTGWFADHFDPTRPPPPTDSHGDSLTFHVGDGTAEVPPPAWRFAE
ncbi:hypothetical protein [Gordonia polyisoprenivorans]|uniref:hypothetical protein n=1 Tax=Gordonia polyisoprenivorans TaxID=84595 RepID=UPI0023013635|nr:hypothetical protein [Gordonia polyisoprenivorans]WCB39462.1 hypothetical protein PHA63_10320 [Gordonia polyisoprenivorans]